MKQFIKNKIQLKNNLIVLFTLLFLFIIFNYKSFIASYKKKKELVSYNKIRSSHNFVRLTNNIITNEDIVWNTLLFYTPDFEIYPKYFYLKTISLEQANIIVEYDNYKVSKLDTTVTFQRCFKAKYPNAVNVDSLFSTFTHSIDKNNKYQSNKLIIINEDSIIATLKLFEKGKLPVNSIINNLEE